MMRELLRKIKKNFFTKQFIIFLLIGAVNTLNGMIVPYVLSLFLQPNIAYVLSYIPNLGISYVLNSFFTFNTRHLSLSKCIKFYVSYLPNFVIQNVVFVIAFNLLGLPKLVGIIVASALGIPITFLLLKYYAFRNKEIANQ